MNFDFASLAKDFAAVMAHAPDIMDLVTAIESEIKTISTGEGGLGKVANASANAAIVAATVARTVSDVHASLVQQGQTTQG
jgi:hypothetical protein